MPKLHGYSLSHNNPIGAPFMIIEYIDAVPLTMTDYNNKQWKDHIQQQLARLYLQFYQLTFDQIGSLTLGDVDESGSEPWVFGGQRPLQSSISEQAVADQDPSAVMPLDRTYVSAVDYYYALVGLAFNDWLKAPDVVRSEKQGRGDLHDLYNFRSCVMDWLIPEHNHGPFYLVHGDLLPSNILVDSDKNFVAIIDWEWCRTVPAQLFVPPAWITGFDILQACHGYGMIGLLAGTVGMKTALHKTLQANGNDYARKHPLTKLWRKALRCQPFSVAHALMRPDKSILVYTNGLDAGRYGYGTWDKRVSAFFAAKDGGQEKRKLVSTKLEEWETFKQTVNELGMELKEQETLPLLDVPDDLRRMFNPTLMEQFLDQLRSLPWYVYATIAILLPPFQTPPKAKKRKLLTTDCPL